MALRSDWFIRCAGAAAEGWMMGSCRQPHNAKRLPVGASKPSAQIAAHTQWFRGASPYCVVIEAMGS
jgi:hypothetical protein